MSKTNKKINVKYNFNLSELNNLDILNSNLNELVSRQTEKAVKKLSKIESKYLTDIVAEICGDCVVVYFKCHNLTILTFYLAVKTVLKTSTNYIYIDSVRVTPIVRRGKLLLKEFNMNLVYLNAVLII